MKVDLCKKEFPFEYSNEGRIAGIALSCPVINVVSENKISKHAHFMPRNLLEIHKFINIYLAGSIKKRHESARESFWTAVIKMKKNLPHF
jgi:hypothetical protein